MKIQKQLTLKLNNGTLDTRFIGIDFGAKKAGTTAISYIKNGELHCLQSQLNEDSDVFIQSFINDYKPQQIFLDAPLSLPKVYHGKESSEFFYRSCDIESKAMSPMFLGGLTARAMRLKNYYKDILFYEAYPSLHIRRRWPELTDLYTSKNTDLTTLFNAILGAQCLKSADIGRGASKHMLDSSIAWHIGCLYQKNQAYSVGDNEEGLIWY